MPAKKLTQAVIGRIPKPEKRLDIRDSQMRGLYLRVYPTGKKVWRLRYSYHDKDRFLLLGEWPNMSLADAHRAALDGRDSLASQKDPAGDVQRARSERKRMPTVAEFADEYITRHAKPNKKTWKQDQRTFAVDVTPYIGKMRLDEVHRRDIVGVLDRIRDRGADVYANRAYAAIRKMFSFAVERGVLDMTPAQQIKLTEETARDAVLTDDAIRELWAATLPFSDSDEALPMHHATRMVLRLLLLTGQRNGEVCGIKLEELDLAGKMWTLPGSRTKNGLTNTVPLSDLAIQTIETALETADETYLFPSNSESGHITNYAPIQAMQRICGGNYRPHDLRRTVATRLGKLHFNRLIMDKILNHKDGTVGGTYDRHIYDDEKASALNAWAALLQEIIEGKKDSKVIHMKSTA